MVEISEEKLIEIIRSIVEEELSKLDMSGKTPRKKRQPSKYNLFMKDCLKKKKGVIQEAFKECALEYKKQKGQS